MTQAHWSCPPVFPEYSRAPVLQPLIAFNPQCAAFLRSLRVRVQAVRAVVLAARWSFYYERGGAVFVSALTDTVREMRRMGKTVLLLSEVPMFPGFRACPILWDPSLRKQCSFVRSRRWMDHRKFALGGVLREIAVQLSALLWDTTPHLCARGVCSVYYAATLRLYADFTHLTYGGGRIMGADIVRRDGAVPWPVARAFAVACDAVTAWPLDTGEPPCYDVFCNRHN